MSPKQKFAGRRFGRLTCTGEPFPVGEVRKVPVRCDCGTEKTVWLSHVKNGLTKSCGCLNREITTARNLSHGKTYTLEYNSWSAMIGRCENPKNHKYPIYGGRGITVCQRWRSSFESFLADMGRRPSPRHSLDRIDVDGNYEPGNCRWATAKEQSNNTRATHRATIDGITKSAFDWSAVTGVPTEVISRRIAEGWPHDVAISWPVGAKRWGRTGRRL